MKMAIGYRLSAIGYFRVRHHARPAHRRDENQTSMRRTLIDEQWLSAIGYRLSAIFTLDSMRLGRTLIHETGYRLSAIGYRLSAIFVLVTVRTSWKVFWRFYGRIFDEHSDKYP